MPLGVRDVLLIIRAQTSASNVLVNLAGRFRTLTTAEKEAQAQAIALGAALVGVGAGIAAVGYVGLKFMTTNTKAAIAYNAQVAYTRTQMQGVKSTFQQVYKVGLDVARTIPVPFETIQGGLYDIFSSMNVNMKQSKTLLTSFAKSAVAGQVSLQDADRATIGILNAYHLKVQDVNKVNDVMFQLVAKGVGTYADFATTIGRAVPSAARAGETIQQLAGMMAFLTRNGLSAANASSSAARALDALVKTGTAGFKGFGKQIVQDLGLAGAKATEFAKRTVDISTAAGKLKPVTVIVREMAKAMEGLSPLQRSSFLTNFFKGSGGTIQAFRFLSTATTSAGAKQLAALTKDMEHAGGSMEKAYKTMANTPAQKIQQLSNDFKVLRVELGEALLPVLSVIVHGLSTFVGWMDRLSPSTLKLIGIIIAIVSALTLLAGIVIAITGLFIILGAVFTGVELLGLPILATIGLIIAAVIALAVAVFFIIKYWGPISKWFHDLWFDIWHWINHVWQNIVRDVESAWTTVVGKFKQQGQLLARVWHDIWTVLVVAFKIFMTFLLLPITIVFLAIKKVVLAFWGWFHPYFTDSLNWLKKVWDAVWSWVKNVVGDAWKWVTKLIMDQWKSLSSAFNLGIDLIKTAWDGLWEHVKDVARDAWHWIVDGWNTLFWNPTKEAFEGGVALVGRIWSGLKAQLIGPVNWVIKYIYDDGIAKIWNTAAGIVAAPKLPTVGPIQFAKGGVVDRPTFGVFGEAGPEMILPLSNPKRMMELLSQVFPMFSGGGIFGSIGSIVHSLSRWMTNGVANLGQRALGPVEALLGNIPGAGLETTLLKDMGDKIIHSLIGQFFGLESKAKKKLPGGNLSAGSSSAAAAQALAQKMLGLFGWGPGQFNPLLALWNQESGWRWNALNPSSGAYGIPQSLPASKMASAGADWRTNPATQIRWGLGYIRSVYGSPAAAWAHEVAFNWYKNGGFIKPGAWGVVGENGPELVRAGKMGASVTSHTNTIQQLFDYWMKHYQGYRAAHPKTYANLTGQALFNYFKTHWTGWIASHKNSNLSGSTATGNKSQLTSEQSTALTIIDAFMSGAVDTLSKIKTEQKDAIREIQKYYSGQAARQRMAFLDRQTKAMESAANHLQAINDKIKAAMSYYNNLKSGLASYAQLSNLTLSGTTSSTSSLAAGGTLSVTGTTLSGQSLVPQLQAKLATLKRFGGALKKLAKMGLGHGLLNQIIQMGPDTGLQYAQAILSSGIGTITQLNKTQQAINKQETYLAKSATNIMFDSGKFAGRGFLSGLKAQRTALDKEMKHFGDVIGKEMAKWFKVPDNRLPVYGTKSHKKHHGGAGSQAMGAQAMGQSGTTHATRNGTTQYITVYTNEIDPRRHAAELGWELSRRAA